MSITITLTFDSMAEASEVLARFANKAVTGAPAQTTVAVAAQSLVGKAKPATVTAAEAAAVDETAGLAQANTAKTAQPAATKPSAEAAAADAPAKIEYPVLQKAVFSLVKLLADRGRQGTEANAIAVELGASTFKQLPPEKWAEALARVEAFAAELQAPAEVA